MILSSNVSVQAEHGAGGLCPKKGVWNFQALEIPAFIGLGEFQTPFFGQSHISATAAWFDPPVSLTQPGESTKVETVNSSPAPFGKNSASFLRTPKAAK